MTSLLILISKQLIQTDVCVCVCVWACTWHILITEKFRTFFFFLASKLCFRVRLGFRGLVGIVRVRLRGWVWNCAFVCEILSEAGGEGLHYSH